LSVPDQLKRLFTSLCAQIDGGHFKNAIRTCDKSAFNPDHCSTFILLIVNASSEAGTHRQGCVANKAVLTSSNGTIPSRFDPRGLGRTRVRVRESVLSVSSASRTRGCRCVG
jgi:hypothetical protein